MQRDRYPKISISPFANTSSLASILSVSKDQLHYFTENIDEFYKPGKLLQKKNGDPRLTHDAKPTLKQVHERIKNRILKQVDYPYYMLGGVSDSENPRSCKTHASIHCGKKILISEDISNFYPNTSYEAVKSIWKHCFHFSDNISDILAKLTTYNGELPQGWKTSGYLANLALWKIEPDLVKILEEKGFSYSRFVDDITVSSLFSINDKDKYFIVSNIYAMLLPCGYSPQRTKHDISSREKPMVVTSLNVNTNKPTIPKRQRNNIRSMVFQIEMLHPRQGRTHSYYKQWISLYGKVNRIKSFHENEGEDLQRRMRLVKPPKYFFQKIIDKNSRM